MTIYVFELEAIPHLDNPEREICIGAMVLCFAKSTNMKSALNKAKKYVSNQGWEVIKVEDQFIGSREMYKGEEKGKEEDDAILECFDEAMEYGVSGIFYTWESEDDEEDDDVEREVVMSTYKLPIGIRIPDFDDYPNGYDDINRKRELANISEGYKLTAIHEEKFTHFVEINIDVDNLWSLFVALSDRLLGDTAYGVVGFKDEKPTLSNFTKKQSIIDIFNKYKFELANDGFIQFGIADYDESSLNEIFITSFKYFQVWTTNYNELIETLNNFQLLEQENLNFIDEFPVVSDALSPDIKSGVRHYSEVIDEIEKKFAAL